MTKSEGQPSAAASKGSGTSYVILQEQVVGQGPVGEGPKSAWFEVGTVVAHTRDAATRKHTGEGEDALVGTFKAVALGSWKGSVRSGKKTVAVREVIA